MSERKIMSLALKVLGFYCIIQAIYFFQMFLSAIIWGMWNSDFRFKFLTRLESIGGMICFAILAYLLIKYSARWSDKLYPSDSEISITNDSPQLGWYELALVIIGIVLLIRILPICILQLMTTIFYSIPESEKFEFSTEFGRHIIMSSRRSLVELTISVVFISAGGLYLVFWSKGLARFIYKIRNKTSDSNHQ